MKPILLRGYIPRIVGTSLILHLMVLFSYGQAVFNANFGNINFLAANKVHKIGTNGSAAGNVTLYTNVITIGGQAIDCVVRTSSISNGSFQLPSGFAGGTIAFDYSSATGATGNQDRFFSPTFNFNGGGGSCMLKFEFIRGGSYNNGTNLGTPVILQNVRLNTYDIDGNGSSNSNQFNEFGGFSSVTMGAPTNILNTYNTTTGLTKFRSNTPVNSVTVTADAHRVRVEYGQVSQFEISVGAGAEGPAYFFLDFGSGLSWSGVTTITTTPILDLNTITEGLDNSVTICGDAKRLTNGAGSSNINLTNSSGNIDELIISFSTASILNGNFESFYPKGSNSLVNDSIKLGFGSNSSQSFTLRSVNFVVQKSVSGGISTLRFSKASGTLTTAQTEMLLDSLHYVNTALVPQLSNRTFTVTVREGSFTTPPAKFILSELCVMVALPVRWIGLQVKANNKNQVFVNWQVSDEINNKGYHVEMSYNGQNWMEIGYVPAKANSSSQTAYELTFMKKMTGLTYFRIKQSDLDGKFSYSWVKKLDMTAQDDPFIWPNPVSNTFNIMAKESNAKIQVMNFGGKIELTIPLKTGVNQIDASGFAAGIYTVRYTMENGEFKTLRMIKH